MATLHFSASGVTIYHLENELKEAGFQITGRSPIKFSSGAMEFLEIALPVAGSSVAALKILANIFIAYINKDRSAEVTLIKGDEKIQVKVSSAKDLDKAMQQVIQHTDADKK
ncbi:hypothetical protein [Dickeya zeae]|uniref:hypothetical protein n=1 Tax=Dickeya zeae TaxID=204042 RepID=UPI00037F5AAB|nr:hypothetical protein [Dickeya zeae]UJR54987.1 hypothetical protein J417_13610 [Dickeya zeae MS1]